MLQANQCDDGEKWTNGNLFLTANRRERNKCWNFCSVFIQATSFFTLDAINVFSYLVCVCGFESNMREKHIPFEAIWLLHSNSYVWFYFFESHKGTRMTECVSKKKRGNNAIASMLHPRHHWHATYFCADLIQSKHTERVELRSQHKHHGFQETEILNWWKKRCFFSSVLEKQMQWI